MQEIAGYVRNGAFAYLSMDMIRIQHIPTFCPILHKEVIEAMLP